MVIAAVIFDLDGVLIDSEQLWDQTRREVVAEHNGHWLDGATEDMMGMSSSEWSAYLHDRLGVPLSPPRLNQAVVDRLLAHYRRHLPLVPGAQEVVARLGQRWPLALASSSNRAVIEAALELAGLARWFRTVVSSEEVPRGKPAPDVYVEAARRLGERPSDCVVVEDSANGIRAAVAAGMRVVAVPNPHFPPPPEVLETASATVDALEDLDPALVG